MTFSGREKVRLTFFVRNVERFSKKFYFSPPKTEKVSLQKVGG